jgi:hypothetical protein
MPPKKSLKLDQRDIHIFWKLSLKGYRFLTCHQLSLLCFPDENSCKQRMRQLHKAGLVEKCFTPVVHQSDEKKEVFTLTLRGARELSRALKTSSAGLAGSSNFSAFFLEHELMTSQFMCTLEAALANNNAGLSYWKSQSELRSLHLKVIIPRFRGAKIPMIPDGLFSICEGGRAEHFFLEADRGTMGLPEIKKKMLSYIHFYIKGIHRDVFKLPYFRVLFITTSAQRIQRIMSELREIALCPNMFLFSQWSQISPESVLGKIWLKCRGQDVSLLD